MMIKADVTTYEPLEDEMKVTDDELKGLIEKYEFYAEAESYNDSLHKENSGVLDALKELQSLRKGVEGAIKEIEKKAQRVVNKYDDGEISFSSGLYESITIIENHVSKYLVV